MDKKGAEMTIGTIIVIILALVVLVIIIYGFSTGWTNLWDKITSFGGQNVNVQSAINSCELACSTNSAYDYCTLQRKVVFGDDRDKLNKKWTCSDLKNEGLLSCNEIDCVANAPLSPAP